MPEQQGSSSSAGLAPKPRRRVALRAVMGILLAVGMIYGWSTMGRQKARKQTEAIQAVTAAGGHVYLDYQWKNGQVQADGRPRQADWLRRLIGPENLDRAVAVDLRDVERPGDLVSRLSLMPYLVDLNASGTRLDDTALETVRGLAGLTRLDLAGTEVTDKGVIYLSRLTRLTSLSLASTKVSDQSVEALGKLKHLRQLDLSATHLTDDAITQLGKMLPKCQIVRP